MNKIAITTTREHNALSQARTVRKVQTIFRLQTCAILFSVRL